MVRVGGDPDHDWKIVPYILIGLILLAARWIVNVPMLGNLACSCSTLWFYFSSSPT